MSFPFTLSRRVLSGAVPPPAADVVVVGGGVIGVMTALFLARAGVRVVLLEKGRVAAEQSSRNWGWIRAQGRDPAELPIAMEARRLWSDIAADLDEDIGLRTTGVTYLAPDARRIYVEIGEMEPGKLYSERETLIYPYQTKGIVLKPGTELRAFIKPENEFFSILEIESTPR